MSSETTDETEILVRKNEQADGWHLANVRTGEPELGEFGNVYREFATAEEAVKFLERLGIRAIFE